MPLSGKVALITGAGKRIGAQIARTLHAAGANATAPGGLTHYKENDLGYFFVHPCHPVQRKKNKQEH